MPRNRSNDENIGRVIRTAREAAGLSIDELAVDVKRLTGMKRGVSREAMRRLEEGLAVIDNVSPAIMAAICHLLGIDMRKLAPRHAEELDRLESFLEKRRVGAGQYPLQPQGDLARAGEYPLQRDCELAGAGSHDSSHAEHEIAYGRTGKAA